MCLFQWTSVKESKLSKKIDIVEDKLFPLDLAPKLTKEGYKCIPSILELAEKLKKSWEGWKFSKYLITIDENFLSIK